ncbi:putative nonribosomal peptide synthetase [Pisolithus orientalis]|uniref:putative nonribosomal peptide synthetase n=1 Tax=Pisolithus orientalis TaxID=936130 RepID=UPI0022250EE6|nr:putative nonribosomal peptide synthetase [Pisolithus orientalis]KAI6009612.1 putative nonribosomal peptide synthetase [Pisolithus orientalis]
MSAEIPVAVIGIGCKFPGGSDNKELYYEFLRSKVRGKDEPGKYHCTKAGFINGIDQFDHLEFGISAKEAAHFDPAIRLTLEAAHAALQDSGIDYRGSNTGVFFGNLLTTTDELDDDRYEINNYNGVGRCVSIRANRISFTFDLRGPSLTVDTACSASATAIHLALCSIKLGEIDQALVVGANTIINPEHTVSFSKLGVLSPTGSSKSFDASADGYARAEGVAAILIKRLDRALQDGDVIYSVITWQVLTMPEGDMQAETIKEAYRVAHRDPAETFFVELHATGTKVGDPIETNAAGKVFSRGRDGKKALRVGSVKANIGHAEGCSFLASLVKVSMMLHHKEIIPNIRFMKANPKIDFPALKMRVQTELEKISPEMAAKDGKWVTSISSYGVGGSNAHVVLETAETVADLPTSMPPVTPSTKRLYLFSVGSLTESALGRWKDALIMAYEGVTDDRTLRSLARDLGRQTRAYTARAFAVTSTLDATTRFSKPVLTNTNKSPKLCLVFSGQGPQHIYMGRQLAEVYPVFFDSIKENDRILVEKYGQASMLERTGLFLPGVDCKLPSNGVWPVQEVVLGLVFVQVAMVDLIRSLGIKYDFVVGHSIGEIAMGYASGHYDREMAVGIATARAAAMVQAEGNGAMVALGVGAQKAKTVIRKVLSDAKVPSGLWIAGRSELVDALEAYAKDPSVKVFAAKLRVTCAFHTPLMEAQEALFKERVAGTSLSQGTMAPIAKVMSTTDGKWLDRDLDVNYCWDNIRRPVLFGTAINKIVTDESANGVVFLEIAPHPVLKAYIEQCLIRRPNPKVPAQNTGEHYQFLEGIGNLLGTGFKNVDFNQLCASPEGTTDFTKAKLPEYPYNKSYCWAESASDQSRRLRHKPRPVATPHFRINVDTHPDLTGHIVFDAVLFPASGYVESILENGAMVVTDIAIHKPLVLNGSGSNPGHAGCVIDGDKWQFKASTNNEFYDGEILMDSVYASGQFSRINPAYDESAPRMFDFEARLACARGSVTGDEFYDAIPSAYRYQKHFRDYLKVVYEVDDENSWGGKAYLTRLEVPERTPDVFGNGYVIHPGILDSITQCGLAMFINMDTKQFDFNGVFLPVKIDALRRWDSRDAPDLDAELKKGMWTYFTGRTWAPGGPFKSDYIVANSEGRILFTIEGFEIARAPDAEPVTINDNSLEERLTTTWQSKSFPAASHTLTPTDSLSTVFKSVISAAAIAGRKVVRAIDLAQTIDISTSLDSTLGDLIADTGALVEYFCAATTPEDADSKTTLMKYPHARSLEVKSWKLVDGTEHSYHLSYDVALYHVDLSAVPVEIASLANFLVPNGVILLTVSNSQAAVEDASIQPLTFRALVDNFSTIPGTAVQATEFMSGQALIYIRVSEPALVVPAPPFKSVIVQPFAHGQEGDLVEIAKNITAEAELWITGNDDAAGIGALSVASCIIAESPGYKIYSVLFEDHSLDNDAREKAVHDLRRNSLLLEQHMKITKDGEVFVRRLVHGGAEVKDAVIPAASITESGAVSAYFPPALGPSEIEIAVEALGTEVNASPQPALTVVGRIKSTGMNVARNDLDGLVVAIASQSPADVVVVPQDAVVSLPVGVSSTDAASLTASFLASWIGLVVRGCIKSSSIVLIHDATSAAGFSAIQVAKRFGSRVLCTVADRAQAAAVSSTIEVPMSDIIAIDNFATAVLGWLRSNSIRAFDIVLNAGGKRAFAHGADLLSVFGSYIHIEGNELSQIPSGSYSTQVLDINRFAAASPVPLAPVLAALLEAHTSQPFKFRSHLASFSSYSSSQVVDAYSLVAIPDSLHSVRIDPVGQLFDPRKSYILVGGSSELGVRITEWMANHGARHVFLTSRRGPRGLTKVDNLYIHYLRSKGVQIEAIAADAISKDQTAAVVERAKKAGPIGGLFVMTVVLRDAKFTNLTQQSFDDVYESKVAVLNTLITCIDPTTIDFMLLFSTIGSVFGNAGQAAYCASQLYLDRISDDLPNTISMSFPPITDSGIFKRLVLATKGKANTAQLTKTGMTTAQVCNFIGDSLVRRITHYVPMLAISDVPDTFPSCEPLLYSHLLPKKFLVANSAGGNGSDVVESPATLLAALLSMDIEQIMDNALITSFGLDSLGATRYSNQLQARFNIQVSQIELLGSMTIAMLNELCAKVGAQDGGSDTVAASDDGSGKYGEPLVPVLNDRLAYDEPYTTGASPHQYRIWLAQREYDNARKRAINKIDANMSRYGATQWDTHEGYFVTISTETPLDVDRMTKAFAEVVQRHGALRTTFTWNEELGKLEQTIYPSVDFKATLVDLSSEPDAAAKAYEMSLALNKRPNFKLDRLPLLIATMFDLGGGDWAFNVVIHHIIIDEASLGVFFYELFQIYLNGPESLPEVPIHYSDFSDWLLKTTERRTELREDHLKFWVENLQETQPLHLTLATPSDQELAPITQIEAKIGVGALEHYTKVINATTATPFAGFFAAYNILLHKYSAGQSSFVVGTAVTQRNLPMLMNVIGFFANLLPIKTVIDETKTFAEYLGEFKDALIASLAHDEVTYEDIVTEGKSSSTGRGYFKHLFAPGGMNMETISQLESNHLTTKSTVSLPNGEEQYEFLLTVHPRSGHVILRFDNHLYTEDAARQFLDAYISLVETLGRDPHVTIRDISVVTESEHERLVKELSSSSKVAVRESLLHRLVEEQAKKTPHLTAVEFEDEPFTYSELNSTANRISRTLIQQGVRHGDVIALCFDRGISQILGVLAVLKAGATFVPLDPDDPTLRKELMVEECGAKVLLTTSNHSRVFQKSLASKVLIVYIDDTIYRKRLTKLSADDFDVEGLTPNSLAYIMFTSGSTGKPKGVMIEHRSISNLVQNSSVYGFQQGLRVMSSLAYTFDPFVVDVFGSLSHGATLVTGRKELVLGDIPQAIRSLRINVLHVTPSILAVVPLCEYPTLKTVVVAGEALGKKLIEDWCGRVTLHNMYGPTEASVDCTSCHVTGPALTGVIGRPLPNCRIYILDKQLKPTPIGVEGDLYIGGIQLARGYLNQPELTAAAFVPNPFSRNERIYKTGDIALYRPDGNVEYCGRADRQIKLRGQRIELGEIEDTIAKYSSVKRAAAVIRTVQDAPAIVAFVELKNVADGQLEEEKEALKVFVAERLPRFMYPSLIAVLPQLPTSRSGKIDRNALKQMDLKTFAPDLNDDIGTPSGDVEVELMKIFSKVLKAENGSFGVNHDLFAVGLNSLMAVQAAGVVSKTFDVHVGLNNIYLRPTIRELGTLIVDAMGKDSRIIMEAEDADADFLIEFLPIKKKGMQPRLFIVHDITGMATPFMRLGAYMPNEMYAIGDKHFGSETGFGSIDAMAEHYISLIKKVQPEGPYVIGGYSYGGSVALCMAAKLATRGEEVAHLILFDPIFIPSSERQSLKSTDWTQRSIDRITSNFPDIGEKWKNKLRTEIRKNLESMFDYEADFYDGPTTLVVPKDRSWYRSGAASDFDTGADDHNGWDARIKNLDMKVAAGSHDTMFTPAHVKVLAGVLKEILATVPGAGSVSI